LILWWLFERLQLDFKTIADFRKDNGRGLKVRAALSLSFAVR